jgi:hypothetical protein
VAEVSRTAAATAVPAAMPMMIVATMAQAKAFLTRTGVLSLFQIMVAAARMVKAAPTET